MLILLWLLPPVVVTCVAMAWAGWVGRARPAVSERSEAAQEQARQRFAEAILRDHPGAASRPPRPRERSTGVAVRRPGAATTRGNGTDRRSA